MAAGKFVRYVAIAYLVLPRTDAAGGGQ
jgi:hypothetical protein